MRANGILDARVGCAIGAGAVSVGVNVSDGECVGDVVLQTMCSQGLRCVFSSVQVSSEQESGSGMVGSGERVSLEPMLLSGLTSEVRSVQVQWEQT